MNQEKLSGLHHLFSIGIIAALLVAGCSREPQKAKAPAPEAPKTGTAAPEPGKDALPVVSEVQAETTILATLAKGEKLAESLEPAATYSNPHAGHGQTPEYSIVFSGLGRGVAYIAEKNGRSYVVHNGKAGKSYQSIGPVVLSQNGQRIAYVAHVNGQWLVVTDNREGEVFDMVGEPVFSPDGLHLAYEAQSGEKWRIVLDNRKSPESAGYFDKPIFSGDSSKLFYIENTADERSKRFILSDLAFNKQHVREYKPGQVVTNKELTRVAAIVDAADKKRVIEFSFSQPEAVKEGPIYNDISYLTFGPDGSTLLYAVEKEGIKFLILKNREERLPEGHFAGLPVVISGNKGAGMIMAADESVFLHQAFHKGMKEKQYEEANTLTYNRDGSLHAYTAKKGEKWFVVLNGKEGPPFDRVVAPVFSPDGKKLVYRARKDGKRFVVVADANGKVIRQHPAYEQVFQPVFADDSRSVTYGVKDGQKLVWKVEKLNQ